MRKITYLSMIAALSFMSAGSDMVHAQSPFAPPLDAMDTLNSAPVGSAGGSNFNPINRANAAVNAANNNPFGGGAATGSPFGGAAAGGSPFGGAAASPGSGFGPGFTPGAGNFGQQQPQASGIQVPQVPTAKAWGGERVTDARTGEILQDGRQINVLESFVGSSGPYKDDGASNNDGIAGDGIYTNLTTSTGVISPESSVVRSKMVKTLEFTSDLSPMEFFQVRVATTESLSPLPRIVDLETDMDKALNDWVDSFLADYMVEDEAGNRQFIPAYVPRPPKAPNKPLPAGFTPLELPSSDGENGGAGGGIEASVAGAAANRFGTNQIQNQTFQDPTAPQGQDDPLGAAGGSRYF